MAGPYAAKLLADYGADVVKIERPGTGDPSRGYGPFPRDVPHPERSGPMDGRVPRSPRPRATASAIRPRPKSPGGRGGVTRRGLRGPSDYFRPAYGPLRSVWKWRSKRYTEVNSILG